MLRAWCRFYSLVSNTISLTAATTNDGVDPSKRAPLYHPWPFHLPVRECDLLHHLSSLRLLIHWGDWEAAAGTLRWTLASIRNNYPGFPVAEHFNSASHSLNDVMICGLKRCSGDNTRRKQQEMKLIFELGTLKPDGLNINFSFI